MVICKECGCKTVLATGYVDNFCPDAEPYENGIIEDSKQEEIESEVSVSIHYCEKCNKIIDAAIESF